ncbi:MAG: hypothetical protein GXW96_06015, partial [Christensenellaceae bacterium]|nr:hypothetical protein [Christensenellaceae bacterium]
LIAIGYQTGVAYVMATLVNLIGGAIFPNLSPIQISGEVEAAGEGAITSAALLENPMVYILGLVIVAVIVIGLASLIKRGGKNRQLDDTTCNY